ncbi:hypothetical protein [Sphingomonas colocasiae]|uniref:Uncharacterized protein n=1 Tax=Sphingomonas colocasiae TaxID=1848973 RepID=A0ABS7PZR3_9SPHN|nr:hypothetical protein [Sphingomonas colocasiae]MBY8823294.1 hypothetical protein [Sphingomonas colocasiae]MBY8826429.1 hypothetical protein [Sphingomonas colocasiae]
MATEHQRWTFAAELLERHGDAIDGFVKRQVDDCIERDDEEGLIFWHDVISKLVRLMGPGEGAGPQ